MAGMMSTSTNVEVFDTPSAPVAEPTTPFVLGPPTRVSADALAEAITVGLCARTLMRRENQLLRDIEGLTPDDVADDVGRSNST